MDYVGQIIRPPSEANSIILQVTVGCSHNKCSFCGAYKEKRFSIKKHATVTADLEFAARYCQRQHKLFLADGDALIIPYPRLLAIFQEIRVQLPWVRRISLYGSARSIRSKSIEQLLELRALGLDRVYLGLESGCDEVLKSVAKGEDSVSMIAAAKIVRSAGLFLSVTVLLGLAGVSGSREHALRSAEVLNYMKPRQVAALTYMPLANTSLGRQFLAGDFVLPEPEDIMLELRTLVERIETSAQFHANHASNYLPIMGRLPRDRDKMIAAIEQAQCDTRQFVPESLRRL